MSQFWGWLSNNAAPLGLVVAVLTLWAAVRYGRHKPRPASGASNFVTQRRIRLAGGFMYDFTLKVGEFYKRDRDITEVQILKKDWLVELLAIVPNDEEGGPAKARVRLDGGGIDTGASVVTERGSNRIYTLPKAKSPAELDRSVFEFYFSQTHFRVWALVLLHANEKAGEATFRVLEMTPFI